MSVVILKYSDAAKNYWGNEAHPDGVGLLTLASIAQATVDVVAAGGQVYLYRRNYFGPMQLEPEIRHVRGAGYRLLLRGVLTRPATGFLRQVVQEVQRKMDRAQGVLVSGRTVRAFHFGDPQPPNLHVVGEFSIREEHA